MNRLIIILLAIFLLVTTNFVSPSFANLSGKTQMTSNSSLVPKPDNPRHNLLQNKLPQNYKTLTATNISEPGLFAKGSGLREVLSNIMLGLIAGILSVVLIGLWREWQMRKKFRFLKGEWSHLDKDNKIIPKAITTIKYCRGGKLDVYSETVCGPWKGRIVMDESMPAYGGGIFQYEGKNESGLIHIIVQDKNLVHVLPLTLTHNTQKTDFYIWKRKD